MIYIEFQLFHLKVIELHKTVMSYHFAFNELILETDNVHRLPFVLDAVFKEDIESQNRDLIYTFIQETNELIVNVD